MTDVHEMKIGEVARQSEVTPSRLRYYERIGVLPRARRVGRQRVYEPEVLERLAVIKTAQELDFTLDEIKLLLTTFDSGEEPTTLCQELVERKLCELEKTIAKAEAIKRVLVESLNCGCTGVHDCFVIDTKT